MEAEWEHCRCRTVLCNKNGPTGRNTSRVSAIFSAEKCTFFSLFSGVHHPIAAIGI